MVIEAVGTEQEQKTFTEVNHHYDTSKSDLDIRRLDFDKRDILFRSHIEETKWPYRSVVFDPRIFTTLYEKTARTFANKPRGRMLPREGGDVLRAKIVNEILSFQWDDNERVNSESMLSKWMQMNLNARKYGASFGLCKWHYQTKVSSETDKKGVKTGKAKTFFDGPNFKVWNNRDVLVNPSYSTIKNWIQLREWLTLQELQSVNDAARSKPIYKNLDILRQLLKQESQKGGDTRASEYVIKNKSIKGLTDYLGTDEAFKTVEIITEYRNDRWITFAPKHGLILRDIPNPYDHGQIPVVLLKYYPIDDDIYGLSEIEPVEKIQRAINAILCQYLDAINMSLYTPLKVSSVGGAVQMHTLEFGPGKKWLMTNPSTDVIPFEQNASGVQEFASTYRFLVGALQEALGETSAVASNADPGNGNKTATEIKDTAISRTARDNFNQIMLGEALEKQMMFWHQMNSQFFFKPGEKTKIIQIAGKNAIKYFQSIGLDEYGVNDEAIDMMSDPDVAETGILPSDLQTPLYPVESGEGKIPKLSMDEHGEQASLILEPEDLSGNYDYIVDVGSMSDSSSSDDLLAKKQFIELVTTNPVVLQQLQAEGKQIKMSDLLTDYAEDLGFKNADQYLEDIQGGLNAGGINPNTPGTEGAQGVAPGMANGGLGGIPAGVQAVPGSQAQGIIS